MRDDGEAGALASWAEQALGQPLLPWQRRITEQAARLHHERRARHPRPGQPGPWNCQFVGGPMDGQTMTMQTFEPVIRANVMPHEAAIFAAVDEMPAVVPIQIGEYHFNYRLQAWLWAGVTGPG